MALSKENKTDILLVFKGYVIMINMKIDCMVFNKTCACRVAQKLDLYIALKAILDGYH